MRRNWEEDIGQILNEHQHEMEQIERRYLNKVKETYRKNLPNIPAVNQLLAVETEEE